MEHVKNTLQNIMTEWTPHSVDVATISVAMLHRQARRRKESVVQIPRKIGHSRVLFLVGDGAPLHPELTTIRGAISGMTIALRLRELLCGRREMKCLTGYTSYLVPCNHEVGQCV